MPSMDRGGSRNTRFEDHEAHQHKPPLPLPHSVNLRMRGNHEDDKEAQVSAGDHDGSRPLSQQKYPLVAIPTLAIRSSALAIRRAAARPNLLVVCTHGSLLALFWYIPSLIDPDLDVIFCPGLWFLIPWTALCCVELLFFGFIGMALCTGRNLIDGGHFLPMLVWLFSLILTLVVMRAKFAESRRVVSSHLGHSGRGVLGSLFRGVGASGIPFHVRETMSTSPEIERAES